MDAQTEARTISKDPILRRYWHVFRGAAKFDTGKRMLKLTWPIVQSCLFEGRNSIIGLGLLSLLLGVVPTLKSELESGVIEQIANQIRRASEKSGSLHTEADIQLFPNRDLFSNLSEPLSRFLSNPLAKDDKDLTEKIAYGLFGHINLWEAVLIFIFIALIAQLIDYGAKVVKARISKDIFATLRGAGMRSGLSANSEDIILDVNEAGQYATAIQQGASSISATYGYILEAGQFMFSLTTTIVLIWTKSWVFALCCLVLISAQIILSRVQAKRLKNQRKELDKQRTELIARSDDILAKRELIAAFDQQENFVHKLDLGTQKFAEVEQKLAIREEAFRNISALIDDYGRMAILVIGLVVAVGLPGSAVQDVGDVYFLLSIYARLYVPISNLLSRYDTFRKTESTSQTFLSILETNNRTVDSKGESSPEWNKGQDIVFDKVTFRYSATKDRILNGCSFRIPAGKTTLVVGPSGCGKSTVARILLRFWRIETGTVRIGGHNLNDLKPNYVRAQLSYVPQDNHIIDETVRENLVWGLSKDGISDEDMRIVLDEVHVKKLQTDNAEDKTDLLDMPAKKLSVGQQQRLSVARMMLDESEIVIMDEPMTGSDIYTIRDMMPHLAKMLRRRNHTVLLISHRLSFAAFCDHVVVLSKNGVVREEGDPQILISNGGEFATLYKASLEELKFSYMAEEPKLTS